MNWVKFPVVKATATVKVRCKCGKQLTRKKTFECTVNPFNRNADGTVKTHAQVREQAQAKADAWKGPKDVVCSACAGRKS